MRQKLNSILLAILIIVMPVQIFACELYQVMGNSMNPTLKNGDIVKIASKGYKDEDIVIAEIGEKRVIKRVVDDKLIGDNRKNTSEFYLSEANVIGQAEKYKGDTSGLALKKVMASQEQWIYYTGTNSKLKKIRSDGTQDSEISISNLTLYNGIISPDGQWIYYTSTPRRHAKTIDNMYGDPTENIPPMYLMRTKLDGTTTETIAEIRYILVWTGTHRGPSRSRVVYKQYPTDIVLSPDGEWIYYSATDGNLKRIKPDGTGETMVATGIITFNSTISPDGQWIYHTSLPHGYRDILENDNDDTPRPVYLKRTKSDGTITENIVQIKGVTFQTSGYSDSIFTVLVCIQYPTDAAISPDGEWIYYSAIDGALKRIKPDGTGEEVVSTNGIALCNSSISSDGQWIYYTSSPRQYRENIMGSDPPVNAPSVYLMRKKLNGSANETIAQIKGIDTQVFSYSKPTQIRLIKVMYSTGIIAVVNTPPTFSVDNPSQNEMFSEFNNTVIPIISASDPNNDTLTCEYYIDSEATPRDTQIISNTKDAHIVRFAAFDAGQLTSGTHDLIFKVSDGDNTVEKTVSIKVDKTAPNLGTVSFASTDRSITVSGSATDTVSGMHASPYRYTVGTNVSGWTSHTSYTQDSLTPNTEYGVKFEARDNTNHIAVKEQAIYTKAQTPQLSVSNNGVATLQLNVTDNNPASTKYQIKAGSKYVTQTGALSAAPVWITLTNKRITVKGLAPNTTYALRAKAQNGAGIDTSWSSTVNGTSLANPPDHISAVPGQTDIKVSWNSISGALGYEIEVDGVVKNNGTSTHYTHSGLLPETSHRYRVRVKNAGGTGSWSSLTTAETLPYPPAKVQNIRCSDYTQTTIDLVWDSVPKASVYEVEANGQIIENGASTTFMHTGLIPETAYQYRVRGKNKGGDGQWSEPFTQATLPNPPAKPVGMNTVITKDSVTLSWAAVEKAEGYEVMADGLITDVGMETTYVHAGLAPLSGHTYKVRAVRAGGLVKGQWSDPIDVTTHPEAPVMPANIMSTAEKTVLTVTWYQVPHAESYDVEIDGSTVVNVTDLMYIHRGLTPDTQHSYRIKAKNITGESEWSMPVKAFTLPESDDGTMALTNVVAVVTNTFITLSWDAAALDAEYDIEVDGVLQENGKETIYNHTGLNPNEYHTYKIRVKNSEGIARWCAVLSLSTLPNPPDAPTSIEAFAGDNSIELRWERVEGATGYDIEINGETVTGGADNRYIHQPLEPGTAHTYRVRAKNITGVTAWSPALVKSTTTPSYIVQCSQDKLFDLSLLADNVQDFTALAFTVTYDVNALEVADLYGATPQKDVIDKGSIPGTDIQVTHTPGKIVFTVDKHMIPGTSWSGELAAVVFKGKITGESEINFTVEEGQ